MSWLRESPDPGRRPVRVAVAIAPGPGDRVIACAAGFSHLHLDHGAIEILKRDFAGLLGDPARRSAGRPGHQPLDQAELEATPAERRRADAALDYLREQSWRIPRCLYALPGARTSGESLMVELSSVAAAMAVRRVAARTRTSRSSIVLAAICGVVARRANYRELVLPLLSSNRFERHLMSYVGSLAQGTIATIEIGGRSFDELVGHTWTTVMEASRHGRYDRVKQAAMDEPIEHQRGLHFDYGPMFNSLVPESWSGLTAGVGVQPEEIDVALARTELRWRPAPVSATTQFRLNQIDGCLRLDVWSALVSRAELESLLLAVERPLVAAAHGDVPSGQMPELSGLEPIPGTPDRILVDHCWVDVADVQRLVDEAVTPAVARVFASANGRPLVAHLAATDAIRTPQKANASCMAALAHHPTAITPLHYVICRTAPPNPADPTGKPGCLLAAPPTARAWSPPIRRERNPAPETPHSPSRPGAANHPLPGRRVKGARQHGFPSRTRSMVTASAPSRVPPRMCRPRAATSCRQASPSAGTAWSTDGGACVPVHVLPGCGHLLELDCPSQADFYLVGFLAPG
jgi:hypothetical protein